MFENLTWFGWTYLALSALGAMLAISSIGKPRQPKTSGEVICLLISTAFFIWGIFEVGVHH